MIKKLIGLGLMVFSLSSFAMTGKAVDKEIDLVITKPRVDITFNAPMVFDESTSGVWNMLSNALIQPDNGIGTVVMYVQGIGGDVLLVNMVTDAIKTAQKQGTVVNMVITGPAISGHAYLTCSASNIEMKSGSSLTFHSAGMYTTYIGGMLMFKAQANDPEFMNTMMEQLYGCVKKGLLTQADVASIMNGKRVVILNTKGIITKLTIDDYASGVLDHAAQISYLIFIVCLLLIFIGLAKRV